MKPQSLLLIFAMLPLLGCGNGGPGSEDDDDNPNQNFTVCDADQGPFSLEIDNEFFPLPVGRVLKLEGQEAGAKADLTVTVLDETEVVAGTTTRVVTESHFEDDQQVEFSRNFFAQAPDGSVCYFGEEVDVIEGGAVVGHEGSWRAGEGSNQPGMIMPGSPQIGVPFAQERAPGIAEDMSAAVGLGESLTVPFASYDNVAHFVDWNPLDGETQADGEDKFYASGVGLIQDSTLELIDFIP